MPCLPLYSAALCAHVNYFCDRLTNKQKECKSARDRNSTEKTVSCLSDTKLKFTSKVQCVTPEKSPTLTGSTTFFRSNEMLADPF